MLIGLLGASQIKDALPVMRQIAREDKRADNNVKDGLPPVQITLEF